MSWVLPAFAAFAGFSLLIMLHELGHFAAAKWTGMRVEGFSLFFGPALWSVQRGDTLYAIRSIPLGGYVKITGMNPREELAPEVAPRAYFRQPVWKRLVTIGAGPFMSLLTAFVLLWGIFAINGTYEATPVVDQVAQKAPATGKLQAGDRIVAVDGVRGSFDDLRRQIGTHRCAGTQTAGCDATTPARVTVERGGRTVAVSVRPKYDPTAQRMLLGFAPQTVRDRQGPIEASGTSISTMWEVTTKTLDTFAGIFTDAQKRKEVNSVVGAYETTRKSFEFSTAQALFLLGVISLSLGIINLFPFLPLDGGHIFWALAEKVRGRAIPFSVMERASVLGFLLVIFVFLIGLTNDVDRLTGEGFNVR